MDPLIWVHLQDLILVIVVVPITHQPRVILKARKDVISKTPVAT